MGTLGSGRSASARSAEIMWRQTVHLHPFTNPSLTLKLTALLFAGSDSFYPAISQCGAGANRDDRTHPQAAAALAGLCSLRDLRIYSSRLHWTSPALPGCAGGHYCERRAG